MQVLIECLRWGVLIAEACVAIYMAPAVYAILAGRGRSLDPARLRDMGNALIFASFASRHLFFPGNDGLLVVLYAVTIAWAAFNLYAARAYGRGDTF